MKLRIIPYTEIEKALEEEKTTVTDQRYCNTCFHKPAEIAAALPNIEHKPPDSVQPWVLLEPWLDLIASSRNINEDDIHRIKLPGSFLAVLITAQAVGIRMGRINASHAEDLEETFPKTTTNGINIAELLQSRKYFVRLNTCSLKDAIAGGTGPVTSVEQLWTRLATSPRAHNGITSMRAYDMSAPIYLYIFPWDDNLRTELEYRVFCPPGAGRIAAISQYKWHARWYHADKSLGEQRKVAERVLEGAETLHRQTLEHPAMTEELRSAGYTFDVAEFVDGGEGVRLIELNDFGALSGCGSCLFQWVRDAQVLYGLRAEVELRVTV